MSFMPVKITIFLLVLFFSTSGMFAKEHRVRMMLSVRNKTAKLVKGSQLILAGPINAKKMKSNHPFEIVTDDLGNKCYRFDFGYFPPFGSKVITFEGRVEVGKSPPGDPADYLGAERFIEVKAPEIVKKARQLKRKSVFKTAKSICAWTKSHTRAGQYIKRQRGALWAMKKGKGDCTEAACLFVALCRVNKIPARVIGGWAVDRNETLGFYAYHNWAEFHDGSRWVLADPSDGTFDKPDVYMATRIVGKSSVMDRYHRFKVISPIAGAIVVK